MKYLHSSRTHNNQIRSNPQQNSSPNLPVLKTKKKKKQLRYYSFQTPFLIFHLKPKPKYALKNQIPKPILILISKNNQNTITIPNIRIS